MTTSLLQSAAAQQHAHAGRRQAVAVGLAAALAGATQTPLAHQRRPNAHRSRPVRPSSRQASRKPLTADGERRLQ